MERRHEELLKCARLSFAHDGHGDHEHHCDREDDAHECGQHVVGGDGIGVVPCADAHVVGRRSHGRPAHSDGLHPHAKPRQGGDGRGRGDGVRGVDNRLNRNGVPRVCLSYKIGRKDNADLCIAALDPLVQLIVAPRDVAQVKIAACRHCREEIAALLAPRLIEYDRGLVPHVRADGKAEHDEIDDRQEKGHADGHGVTPHLNELLDEKRQNPQAAHPLCRRS